MAEARDKFSRTEAELREKIIKGEMDMARVKIESDSALTEKSKVSFLSSFYLYFCNYYSRLLFTYSFFSFSFSFFFICSMRRQGC